MRGLAKAALEAVVAFGFAAGGAGAQNLDLDEMAAALALPVVTGGQATNPLKATTGDVILLDGSAITLATVTNGRSSPLLLKIDVISGDPNGPGGGDNWSSDSWQCLLTGRETTTFLAVPDATGLGSTIFVECSTAFGTDGIFANNVMRAAKAQNGIMWVAAADPATGATISEDVIFGDAVVVDIATGQAYGFGAIPFQAGQGFNDGDKIFRFDNQEYVKWPSVLAANFIAPDASPAARINAELILFTLDGTVGSTAPRVALGGIAYDDDESFFDFQHEFDCFDIVALDEISLNFTQPFLGSLSGHFQLVPQPVATANDAHDAAYGDANNSRRRPVHGWIVQQVLTGASVVLPGQPTSLPAPPGQGAAFGFPGGIGPAAWARPLAQGRSALRPFLGDGDPTLDTDPLL